VRKIIGARFSWPRSDFKADIVLDGLRGLLEQARPKRWLLSDQNWWEMERWPDLLPFSERPMATLDGMELVEANRRQPWRLRGSFSALAYAPSSKAGDVLKALP
jgi:hypothetical protein